MCFLFFAFAGFDLHSYSSFKAWSALFEMLEQRNKRNVDKGKLNSSQIFQIRHRSLFIFLYQGKSGNTTTEKNNEELLDDTNRNLSEDDDELDLHGEIQIVDEENVEEEKAT